MDPTIAVLIAVAALFLLLLARVPVAFALLSAGIVGTLLAQGSGVASGVLGRTPFDTPASYVLIIIPMFIAMGIFAKHGTIAEDGFAVAARFLRRVPGGLALATVVGCAGFAAVSGSSVATVATLGPLAVREMESHGYDRTVAAGIVGASGTLGVLIPPSIVLVIFGILTGESIGQLLVAGIIPGILSAVAYAAAIVIRARRRPELMGSGNAITVHARPKGMVLGSVAKITILFVVVIGGIYGGVVTPTEAASLGAAVALAFYLFDLRRTARGKRLRSVRSTISEATQLTSMAFALLIGGAVFTYLLVIARVPTAFASWVVDLDAPGLLIVAIILLAFIPLGMFLDPLSTMLIAVPLTYPAVSALGFDGLWFGILVVKMIEIGLITPPFGINAFVLAGSVPGVSVGQAFRGVLWFLPLDLLTVAFIFALPEVVTWLPSIMNPI